MEKDAAGYPSLPLHYGLMNPGTSRTSPAAYPTSSPVLRGGGGGDAASLPDPLVEIGSRSFFVNQVVGRRQSPGGEGLA